MFTQRLIRIGTCLGLGIAGLSLLRGMVTETSRPGAAGGDVIVGDIYGTASYGVVGRVAAFSVGTTSCNVGTEKLDWKANPDTRHPVIAQNLYRLKGGRFEQIGMSWLKHGFSVVAGNLCGNCTQSASDALHVNCSDPYGPGLNGAQNNLGPRSAVNAFTGVFPALANLPTAVDVTTRRLQVDVDDIAPELNEGATYFVEAQYVHVQDAAAGNGANNASFRPARFELLGGTLRLALTGTTERARPAVQAWADADPSVRVIPVDIPGEGRLHLAIRSGALPDGGMQHVVALHNLNSDRSVRSLFLEFSQGPVSDPEFRDVPYHSGEPYDGTDWPATATAGSVAWTTASFEDNANANALRWGTTYTFVCKCAGEPTQAKIGLFKPGPAAEVVVALGSPSSAPSRAAVRARRQPWLRGPEDDLDLGVIGGATGKPSVEVSLGIHGSIDDDGPSVASSDPALAATVARRTGKGPRGWTITLSPRDAKPGHFESIITLTPGRRDLPPLRFRVFGTFAP
jgi:hypothetical protein